MLKMAIPGLFFLYFRLSNTVDIKMFITNYCPWLDSNCKPLELDVTALPTEPQPLARCDRMFCSIGLTCPHQKPSNILPFIFIWIRSLILSRTNERKENSTHQVIVGAAVLNVKLKLTINTVIITEMDCSNLR